VVVSLAICHHETDEAEAEARKQENGDHEVGLGWGVHRVRRTRSGIVQKFRHIRRPWPAAPAHHPSNQGNPSLSPPKFAFIRVIRGKSSA